MKVYIACFMALFFQSPLLTTGTGNANNVGGGQHSMSDRKDDNANLVKESAENKNYIDSASRNMVEEDTNVFAATFRWPTRRPTKQPTKYPTKYPTKCEYHTPLYDGRRRS